MTETELHKFLVITTFALAAMTFVILFRVTAPYGRHIRPGWGPTLSARLGWIVMESPAVLLFAAVYLSGENALTTTPLVLLGMWQFHYVYRTFVFPFRLQAAGKRMPIVIVAMAILFNSLNAYINARWIAHLGSYETAWLLQAPFLLGAACFAIGWAINQHADATLLGLRRSGNADYGIPRGGLYRWISCPNYLGEMLEWIGWAIATWSLAGAAFAVFTVANLLPRALANHRWYRHQFADYPPDRHAVIPGLL